mmetsp:Transcript_79249/g.240447  ORF Transcript_79249/g.240447 Transcript_79249/m.240447 type:complete len:228 (+) Transcript_79249:75-758(+)
MATLPAISRLSGVPAIGVLEDTVPSCAVHPVAAGSALHLVADELDLVLLWVPVAAEVALSALVNDVEKTQRVAVALAFAAAALAATASAPAAGMAAAGAPLAAPRPVVPVPVAPGLRAAAAVLLAHHRPLHLPLPRLLPGLRCTPRRTATPWPAVRTAPLLTRQAAAATAAVRLVLAPSGAPASARARLASALVLLLTLAVAHAPVPVVVLTALRAGSKADALAWAP